MTDTSNVYLCTLATPFFRLFETKRDFPVSESLWFMLSAAGAYFSMQAFDRSLRALNPVTAFLVEAVLCWLIGWKLGGLLHRLLINPFPRKGEPTAWQQKPRLLSEATVADASVLADRLLILRGIDDEAGLSLAVGAATNRLLRFLYAFLTSVGVSITLGVVLGLAFLLRDERFENVTVAVFLSVYIVSAFALLLPSIIRPLFGRELAFGVLRCDAAYDSVPDASRAKVTTLHDPSDQARSFHSLYQNPVAPRCIAEWIAKKVVLSEN